MKLASIFQDNMVLQRDRSIPVWGWGGPGESVAVELSGGASALTKVAKDGRWKLNLPPVAAGGPFELRVKGAGEHIVRRNVMVGEVWVCSGQSNMEWPLAASKNAEQEVLAANYPGVRMLNVGKVALLQPQSDLTGSWAVAAPDIAGTFSAVGYFFARELHKRLGVAVGMINSSWGGTLAEAWTSREGLDREPDLRSFGAALDAMKTADGARAQEAYRRSVEEWNLRNIPQDPGGTAHEQGWAALDTDAKDWKTMALPTGWQAAGLAFSGVLWFRREIDVPAAWAGKDLSLNVGACDKNDITYFNNVKVGSLTMAERPDAWNTPRSYTVPGRLVRAGRNVVAVRVFSNMYQGGMIGPAGAMWVAPTGASPDQRIRLHGDWAYRVEHNFGVIAVTPPPAPLGDGNANTPTILHNGMIAPVAPYAIRGAIWYQGESNADRPAQYRVLFPAMISDWRRAWGQGDFPFYFVQLANYMGVNPEPVESLWAELREAQRATLALPQTGMATIIDIGEAGDIHPKNKQDVGLRLALIALAKVHGKSDVVHSGPIPRAARRQGQGVVVEFDSADGGVRVASGELKGFAVAGADKKYRWAAGRVEGRDRVVLSCAGVPQPCHVRYAWADNPVANLTNGSGLPASPFELAVS